LHDIPERLIPPSSEKAYGPILIRHFVSGVDESGTPTKSSISTGGFVCLTPE